MLLLRGVGIGLAFVPAMSAAFAALRPDQLSDATPQLNVVQRIGAGADGDWAEVALAGGYCDQPHLAHEFRAFSGMTPGDYAASDRPFVNHVAVD